jgi:hypothetical protein
MQPPFTNAAKVGNFVGGFATNSSVISNNMSMDKHYEQKNPSKKQFAQKLSSQGMAKQLAQFQVNYNTSQILKEEQNIPMKQKGNQIFAQKQRPHSSFKAQTQKQINTGSFKHQIINGDPQGSILIGANGVVGINGMNVNMSSNKPINKQKNKNYTH